MSYFTSDDARIARLCPYSFNRVHGEKSFDPETVYKCQGAICMAWRWRPLQASDPDYMAAVKKAEANHGKKAAQYVNEHRAELGLSTEPTHGYCGLAGRPDS